MKKISNSDIKGIAGNNGIGAAALLAFIEVESGSKGFDDKTGKILIQFEPHWFRKKAPYAPSGAWSVNKVEVQTKEWIAFNNAFAIDAEAAMMSTSIGMPQIMGFHWQLLGYSSVGAMWDDFKRSEYHQILALVRFLKAYKGGHILRALKLRDFHAVATLYNGAEYKAVAKRYGRVPYDEAMQVAYDKYVKLGY